MISVNAILEVNVDVEEGDNDYSRQEQARAVMIDLLQSGCDIVIEEDP